ncbi:MAG TPA: hypothetical protein VN660_02055 [Steroidobacteraceae bacterium]|nr:hypothetical protein [Steroidobacteraceae bacterium]
MSGGSQTTKSSQSQQNSLPSWLIPSYQANLTNGMNLLNAGLGATSAGPSMLGSGMSAINGVDPQAIGTADSFLNGVMGPNSTVGQEANGSLMNPNSNPYLSGTFTQAANGVQNQIASEFAGNGRNVTSSMPVQADAFNNLANQIYGGAYNTNLAATQNAQGQQLQAANLAPGVTQGLYTPGQEQLQAGQTPFNLQSWYSGLLGQTAAPFGQSNMTGTSTVQNNPSLLSSIGGGMSSALGLATGILGLL